MLERCAKRFAFLSQLDAVLNDDQHSFETKLASLQELATEHRLYFEGVLAQSLLEDAQLRHPNVEFLMGDYIGRDLRLADVIRDRALGIVNLR